MDMTAPRTATDPQTGPVNRDPPRPARLGPRPLPLHLMTAAWTCLTSSAAYPLLRHGLLPWKPELEADLATKWEKPDASTFVFTLAPNIKWQNVAPLNGREFKVDDIKYMINRGQTHAKNTSKTDWLRIQAVEDDRLTLKVASNEVNNQGWAHP